MRYFLLLKLCFLGLFFAQAQEDTNTLLWKVHGNNLSAPSYLFGTYHFAGKSFADSLPQIERAYSTCNQVIGELIMDESVSAKLLPAMFMKDTLLSDLLDSTQYLKVDSFVYRYSNNHLKSFNKFKPAALQLILVTFIAPKTVAKENDALDTYFQKLAKADAKELIGLETADEQINLFFSASLKRQTEQLLLMVAKGDENIIEAKQLYTDYKNQNLSSLEKTLTNTDGYTPEEMDMLLKNRNLKWMPTIEERITKKPTFIAVGAGHLVGPYGLINLLKKAGYSVKPVYTN